MTLSDGTYSVTVTPTESDVGDTVEFKIGVNPLSTAHSTNEFDNHKIKVLLLIDDEEIIIRKYTNSNGTNINDVAQNIINDYGYIDFTDLNSNYYESRQTVIRNLYRFGYYSTSSLGGGTHTVQFQMIDEDDNVLVSSNVVTFRVIKPVIATATSTVSNGRSETSNLSYNTGYNRNSLVPGNSYTILSSYLENNKYNEAVAVGELEMLKRPTYTTISGNTNISLGENVTLTISVKDGNNNNITNGYITIYDGNNIIQQNYALSSNSTQITFTPNIAGSHDIYAVYTDSGVENNTSTSNHLTITVDKIDTFLDCNIDVVEAYLRNVLTISGTLTEDDSNNIIPNATVKFYDYNGSLLDTGFTDSSGRYAFGYILEDRLANNQNLTIVYEGDNTRNGYTRTIPIHILTARTYIDVVDNPIGVSNYPSSITVQLLDEWGVDALGAELKLYDDEGNFVYSAYSSEDEDYVELLTGILYSELTHEYHDYVVSFDGDEIYGSSEITVTKEILAGMVLSSNEIVYGQYNEEYHTLRVKTGLRNETAFFANLVIPPDFDFDVLNDDEYYYVLSLDYEDEEILEDISENGFSQYFDMSTLLGVATVISNSVPTMYLLIYEYNGNSIMDTVPKGSQISVMGDEEQYEFTKRYSSENE